MADAAMMRTVSNLTRRWKAKRLQDGIDRYVPISRQDGWTITRSITTSSAPRLPTASAVDRCKGPRGDGTTPRGRRVRAQSTALMETELGALRVRMKYPAGHRQTLRRSSSISLPTPRGARECRRDHRRTIRVDSEGSIARTLGVRESAQKRCQPIVKCDGNCNEIPVKAW